MVADLFENDLLHSSTNNKYKQKSHTCELSNAGCSTALVVGLMSHTSIPSSCPLRVSVDVCKQRQLVSGH